MYPGWPVTICITESVTGHAAVYPVRKEHRREQVKEKSKYYRRKKVIEQTYRSQDAVVLFLVEQPALYAKPHVLLIKE